MKSLVVIIQETKFQALSHTTHAGSRQFSARRVFKALAIVLLICMFSGRLRAWAYSFDFPVSSKKIFTLSRRVGSSDAVRIRRSCEFVKVTVEAQPCSSRPPVPLFPTSASKYPNALREWCWHLRQSLPINDDLVVTHGTFTQTRSVPPRPQIRTTSFVRSMSPSLHPRTQAHRLSSKPSNLICLRSCAMPAN
jgi:hypothetical protein